MLRQQKYSVMSFLSGWGLELFEWPSYSLILVFKFLISLTWRTCTIILSLLLILFSQIRIDLNQMKLFFVRQTFFLDLNIEYFSFLIMFLCLPFMFLFFFSFFLCYFFFFGFVSLRVVDWINSVTKISLGVEGSSYALWIRVPYKLDANVLCLWQGILFM